MLCRGFVGWLGSRDSRGFGRARWRSWRCLPAGVLVAVLVPVASAQRLGVAEASFVWPRASFAGEELPASRTPVELEVVGAGAGAELHVTVRTLREMGPDGEPLVWNRSGVYRYSWVDRGALFLAVPEDVDVDYASMRVEVFDKVLGLWVGLTPPAVERVDRGPWVDVAIELFDRVTGLAAGPVILVGQVAAELVALGEVAQGRIDVRELVPPLEGGFVDPNNFDLVSLRFVEPGVAVEYPSGGAGVSGWYSASDFFDLRFDPTMEIRFVVPVGGASSEALEQVEGWLVFVQHYAAWGSTATSASVVDVVPHAVALRPGDASLDGSEGSDAAPIEVWTHQFGTSEWDVTTGLAVDAAGNVLVAGVTRGALVGANAGESDAFVRKLDANGRELWTDQFGTDALDVAVGVAVDAAGNVLVVGFTDGALVGANAGESDAFVRKLDAGGRLLWTRQFGTSALDAAVAVAVDKAGNVLVAGSTDGALAGASAGRWDGFVRKLDFDGRELWTHQFGTSESDEVRGVAVDAAGNAHVAGGTRGSLAGANAGNWDALVRKVDVDGRELWTHQFGTDAPDVAAGVAVDAAGNVLVAGLAGGALAGANAGESDAFVRKLIASGLPNGTEE